MSPQPVSNADELPPRDPRLDPAPGDEVGVNLPRSHRILAVDRVARVGAVLRVHGRAIERDLGTGGWCERIGPFEVTISHWREGNAGRAVFRVATEGLTGARRAL